MKAAFRHILCFFLLLASMGDIMHGQSAGKIKKDNSLIACEADGKTAVQAERRRCRRTVRLSWDLPGK